MGNHTDELSMKPTVQVCYQVTSFRTRAKYAWDLFCEGCLGRIPLGSCTMKLNAATEMQGITMTNFADIHPYAPDAQAQGYLDMFEEIKSILCRVTGYDGLSLQPNSGAQVWLG